MQDMVFVDLETRSRVDLNAFGGRAYARSPTSEILCAVALIVERGAVRVVAWSPWRGPRALRTFLPPRTPARVFGTRPAALVTGESIPWEWHWETEDPPPAVRGALLRGVPACAHNAHGFDRHVWAGMGWPQPSRWYDSLDRVRRAAYPGRLNTVSKLVYGTADEGGEGGKDDLGKKVLQKHMKPQAARNRGDGTPMDRFQDPAPPAIASITSYCAKDVLLTACLWYDLGLGLPHPDDAVLELHERIDERGVPIDLTYAQQLADAERRLVEDALGEADRALTDTTRAWMREKQVDLPSLLNSQPQLLSYLNRFELGLEDVQAETLERLERLDPEPAAVVRARLVTANVTRGKLAAIQARVDPDGFYRGWSRYYGGHTGRWSATGAQLHNWKREPDWEDVEGWKQKQAPLPEQCTTIEQVSGVSRRVVCAFPPARLSTIDANQIEARTLLWFAGDQEALDVYRRGEDAYVARAASIYGVPPEEVTKTQRQVGKVAILALGYQGGVRALVNYAAKMGIDLRGVGLRPVDIVEGWRDSHPLVAGVRTGYEYIDEDPETGEVLPDAVPVQERRGGLWKEMHRMAHDLAGDRAQEVTCAGGKLRCFRDGPDVVVMLPSGRPQVYRFARVERVPDKRNPGETKLAVTYESPRGGRRQLYGGLLTENVVQGTARDVLADAALRIEAAGFLLRLHVHDELVSETWSSRDHERVLEIANDSPPWTEGLPVVFEGAEGPRWSK